MKKLITLFALLTIAVTQMWAADLTISISQFTKTANTYEATFSTTKLKSYGKVYVEVPSATVSGTVSWKGEGSNTSRFVYIYKTNGTVKDESRKMEYKTTYESVDYTADDIATVDNKYYLVFGTGDDYKAVGVKYTVPAATNKYTVTFNAGTDGSCATTSITEESAGAGVVLPAVTNVTEGKAFAGWYTAASGGTLAGAAGNTYYPSENLPLYAQYNTIAPYATPTIKEINGTVQISSTDNVEGMKIKYSLDNGANYSDYTIPFNLSEAKTVKAYVTGTSASYIDSDVAEKSCGAIPAATEGSSSLTLYYNTTDMTVASATPKGLTGKAGTDYEGWGITLNSTSKDLGSGNDINSKKSLKGSNAVQVKITMPEGVKANRVTIYSYNNGDFSSTSLWSEVAGTAYTAETEVGLASKSASTPDVRVFALNDVEGTLTINNNGAIQQCFIAVVDYIAPVVPAISAENVNIAKEATNEGEIAFTVENPVEGGVVTAAEKEEADWLTLGAVAGGKVAFTATANTTSSARVATVTLTYTYNTNETVTKDVTITQAPEIDGTVIIRSDITSSSATDKAATGTVGGTTSYTLQNSAVDGGYKFNAGAYASLTLANGTFKTGDIINIYITKECDMTGNIIVYGSTANDVLYNTEVQGIVGENVFVLPEAVNGLSTISIRRTGDNAWNAYVKYIEVTRSGEKVSIINLNSKGYATYSKATDFEYAGADAYGMKLTATSLSGTKVTTGKIKAGAGILFKGAPNANVMITETTGAEALENNSLIGTTDINNDIVPSTYTYKYALSGDTFKKLTGALVANKAFFGTNEELSNSLDLVFDGATAINNVNANDNANAEAPVKVIKNGQLYIGNYNVAGQQVK